MRAWTRRGDDREAAAAADELSPSLRADPSIAIERARARMRQGYIARARLALEEADTNRASPGQRLILSLEGASLMILERSAIHEAREAATAAMTAAASESISELERAEAERINARVELSSAIFYEVSQDAAARIVQRLPGVADVLEAGGLVDESLSARLTYAERLNVASASLEAYADIAERATKLGRPQTAAEAFLGRAERLSKTNASTELIQADLDKAAALYDNAQHISGPISVRRARLKLAIDREFARFETFAPVVDEYLGIDFPRGALSALIDASQMAHEHGDTVRAAEYRQRTLKLAEQAGMGMMRDSFRLAQADLLIRSNQYTEAIDLCCAAITQHPPEFVAACYRQLLASAYSFVNNYTEALSEGRKALAAFESAGAMDSASVVATKLANDLINMRQDQMSDDGQALLTTWIAKDQERGDAGAAISKYELTAQNAINQFHFSPTRSGRAELLESAEASLTIAENLTEQLPAQEAARRKGNLFQLRGQVAQSRGDPDGPETGWRRALETQQKAGLEMEAANSQFIIGVIRLNRANQQLQPNFGESERNLNAALEYYARSGMRSQAADTHFMLAQLYTNASISGPESLRDPLRGGAMKHLASAESEYDAIRREYSTGSVLEAQRGKRVLIERSRRIPELALNLITGHYKDAQMAWDWTQRAKARALSDTLATGLRPPATILNELRSYPESYKAVTQERELAARLNAAPEGERQALREELTETYARLTQDPHLANYLALRLGAALSADDLSGLLAPEMDAARSCVCVDWFSVGDRLWIVTLPLNGVPYMERLPIDVSTARQFVMDSLGEESFRSTLLQSPELLRSLDPLIAPLAYLTKSEDLLIFSPTGPLNAIPLHALHLADEPLLVRNPVAYCPSFSILRHCLARVESIGLRSAAILGDPSGDRPFAAALAGEVAGWFGAEPVRGAAVTRQVFRDAVAANDLVHFQGHAKHNPDDPLKSMLMFADSSLSAGEIFDIPRMRAELVTLAACESAANVIATGDEPLGLIPALLYAGANAVLATLWRVHQQSAALTMRYFYRDLKQSEGKLSKVDALRKAALAVRDTPGFEAEYHWAPFVLNGDWR